MKRISLALSILLFFTFSKAFPARADELSELKQQIKAMQKHIEAMQARIEMLEAQKEVREVRREPAEHTPAKPEHVKYTPGEGIGIEPLGLTIKANATGIFQGTPNANNAGANEDSICDASWKADIEIEKQFDNWGFAYMELEAGQGDTVEPELSLFSNVNNNASDTGARVNISKIFYQQYLLEKQITLTCGKVDPKDFTDQNEFAGDDSFQFLGRIFNHNAVAEWPVSNCFGAHLNVSPKFMEFLIFDLGYYETDANWEDMFDHPFYTAQITLKPADLLGVDPKQWAGNYRFYGWINDRSHAKLVDAGESASDQTKEMNYGFGLSCDQKVTDIFGLFGRFGWHRPDIIRADGGATTEWLWTMGAQMTGKYWMRENDAIGFGVGQIFPSKEYKDAGNGGSAEGHIEAYYKCQLNKCLAITPDFQVIWNPDGASKSSQGDNDTIFVYGVRAHVDF